jgi:hypothetical protein
MKPKTLFRSFEIWVQTYRRYTVNGLVPTSEAERIIKKVLTRHRRRLARTQTA